MRSGIEKGLKGGVKRMWLDEHRNEVLDYCDMHGVSAALEHYNMTIGTLERLYRRSSKAAGDKDRIYRDRVIVLAEMANTRSIEVQKQVEELKRMMNVFQDKVSQDLVEKFFKPLLHLAIEIPEELDDYIVRFNF